MGNECCLGYSYEYDALQRRTRSTWSDGSAWVYDYNDRNELISAKRYWSDFNPVFGQQYDYAFDNIGNRTTNRFGGDTSGANLRSFTYTANNLNQYSSRTVPGYLEVVGAAQATATSVTVNGSAADNRKVEYFAKELSITNGSGPVWQGISAIATLGSNNTTNSGNVLVPPATQNFAYDLDGNLTNDSVWVYKWDAENRLTQMTNLTTVSTAARKKLVFTYDHLGRRATKKVYLWASTDYSTSPVTDERFIYDGWNLIAQISATNNTPIRSYLWGKDLSGSINGAGGIGGLVLVSDHQAGAYHFATYDGNGNVTALVKTDGTSSANYEFDSFGQSIRVTGALAKANPFRFSTKFTDDETDLIYYSYRYYHPSLGKWLNRDPFSRLRMLLTPHPFRKTLPAVFDKIYDPEFLPQGLNLYCFVGNNSINSYDGDGQFLLLDLLLGELLDAFYLATYPAFWASIGAQVAADLASFGVITGMVVQAGSEASVYVAAYVGTAVYLSKYGDAVYEAGYAFTGFMTPGAPSGTGYGPRADLAEIAGFSLSATDTGKYIEGKFEAAMDYILGF